MGTKSPYPCSTQGRFGAKLVNSPRPKASRMKNQENRPENPIKLRDTIEAAIRVEGTPLNVSGISECSILARTPEKRTSAREKARPVPKALTIDFAKD